MKFNAIFVLGFVSAAVAVPAAMSPSSAMLARAINYGAFTAEELANADPEACCCCVPPSEITNVDTLHRIIEANQKVKRDFDFSMFSEEEKANVDPEACCCCVPPSEIKNVDALQRIVAATA